MTEEAVSGVVQQKTEAPANGHAAAPAAPAAVTPDEVIAPKGTPPEQASPEQLAKMYDAVRAMSADEQLAVKRALLKRLQEEVGDVAPAGAASPEPIDPGAFDSKMTRVLPPLPEFTREAMERSGYEFKGKKVYPPFDGLIETRIERPNGDVLYVFKLSAPFLCQNCYGELVTVPRGKPFITAASTSMRVQLDEAYEYQKAEGGKCHVRGRPLGWGTNAAGKEGILWDCRFEPLTTEPDAPAEDKTKPRMFEKEDE